MTTEVRRTRTSTAGAGLLVAAVVVLATVPWWASEARTRDLVEFFCLLAFAQMWNLLAGYAGLVSIGQQAFIGIGAYGLYGWATRRGCTRSSRSRSRGWPPWAWPCRRPCSRSGCAAATSRSGRG